MSGSNAEKHGWGAVLRLASRRTVGALPWVWVATMVPVVVEGAWKPQVLGRTALITLAIAPLVFAIGVAVAYRQFGAPRGSGTSDRSGV